MKALPAPIKVTAETARRFMRRALLLDAPAPDIASAIEHHGYVQIDPINVCGRMHDLILRNRVADYREGGLMRHLHGDGSPLPPERRTAFEQHLPFNRILAAFPLDAWPHLLAEMRARAAKPGAWSGRLTKREKELAGRLLAEIAARGPLNSGAIDDNRRAKPLWGQASLAKATLQKLFFHGRLLIARREGGRRFYDLPERVLPASVLRAGMPSQTETARWAARLKLRQRRLALLTRAEVKLIEDLVQPVSIDGCPMLHCLRTDAPLFDEPAPDGARLSTSAVPSLLLAPLDPVIYDRRVTAALWGFDYAWEVYSPAHKRVRGYYALPVLAGTEFVGHVDPKADRAARRLRVVSRSVRRGHEVGPIVGELAAFLGLRA